MFKIKEYYMTVNSFLTVRKRFMEGTRTKLDEIFAQEVFGAVDITSSEAVNIVDNAITDKIERIELHVRLNGLSFKELREFAEYNCSGILCEDCKHESLCSVTVCSSYGSIKSTIDSVIARIKGE